MLRSKDESVNIGKDSRDDTCDFVITCILWMELYNSCCIEICFIYRQGRFFDRGFFQYGRSRHI